jgi:hypothetical protein
MSEYELLKAQLRSGLDNADKGADGLRELGGVVLSMKEAAAAIDALEAKLATCEKYRDAYAECDRIGTQAVRDLEVRLAKAHEKEIAVWSENYAALERKLEAARADTKKAVEALLLACVHVANNEQGWSVGRASARSDLKIINATLAEIEGEK